MSDSKGIACPQDMRVELADLSRLALMQAPFVAFIVDAHGAIVSVNDAFLQVTGFERNEILGRSWDLLRCGARDDTFCDVVQNRLKSGESWSDRMTIPQKNGGGYRARSIITPLVDGNEGIQGYSFFAQDSTDDIRMEAQLGHLQKMEAIGEMAAGIAHEINTPIQYIGDNIQFLRESSDSLMRLVDACGAACELGRNGPITGEVLDDLEALRQEIDWDFLKEEVPLALEQALEGRNRVADIVRAMKEFAHPGDEELSPVDVNRAIENTLAVSRGEWKHVAEVVTNLATDLPPAPCYPGSFNQVLLNLVVNASHAVGDMRQKRQGGKGQITISSALDGRWITIVIADDGCGIPAENLSRIFEPFFTTKDVGKGTGQGLALTHAVIVDRMKGRIEVDSTPGQGTRFVLYLPLDRESDGTTV